MKGYISSTDTPYGHDVRVKMERKHPESHFEPTEFHVERAGDGSFMIKKHKALKKKFAAMEGYSGRYREPETATAADLNEAQQHMAAHYGKRQPSVQEEENEGEEY